MAVSSKGGRVNKGHPCHLCYFNPWRSKKVISCATTCSRHSVIVLPVLRNPSPSHWLASKWLYTTPGWSLVWPWKTRGISQQQPNCFPSLSHTPPPPPYFLALLLPYWFILHLLVCSPSGEPLSHSHVPPETQGETKRRQKHPPPHTRARKHGGGWPQFIRVFTQRKGS